ncbi:MAG TPA: TraR/DksA family transcriptional regulator [Desulfobacteraceae bacterium]|nr:TraR/DksA family transcriptional regulator [Desulfobacteraceae bacterium]
MRDNREDFLSKLTEKKREFEHALQCLLEKQKEYQEHLQGEASMDESDQALREISVSNNYSLIERKSRELKKLAHLISQVSSDKHFGVCEECGDPIPPERLLIVPEATLCVGCQRELEKMDSLKSAPKHNSIRLRMPPMEDLEDENQLPVLDNDELDADLDITPLPFMELEESADTVFSNDR